MIADIYGQLLRKRTILRTSDPKIQVDSGFIHEFILKTCHYYESFIGYMLHRLLQASSNSSALFHHLHEDHYNISESVSQRYHSIIHSNNLLVSVFISNPLLETIDFTSSFL